MSRWLGLIVFVSAFFTLAFSQKQSYPDHWWAPVEEEIPSWEITPDKAEKGKELILSKRNELGVFSNFGAAGFILDGVGYASVEGLWQMMKYPDPTDESDPRNQISGYPHSREQVKMMTGFEAKKAGDAANKVNKNHGISWVSYQGEKFNYKDHGRGSQRHYEIIREGIRQKVLQNPEVLKLLKSTGDLTLRPDHPIKDNSPPSYYYFDILMELREEQKSSSKLL